MSGEIPASNYSDISHWGVAAAGRSPGSVDYYYYSLVEVQKSGCTPPPPKGAPAAVQEPVLSIFQGNHLNISGEIPASDYLDISSLGSPQRRGGAPGASREWGYWQKSTRYTPPPPKGAPAAVQELVLSIFRKYHLIISGEIRASDYSDISSLGSPQRRGGAPGASSVGGPRRSVPGSTARSQAIRPPSPHLSLFYAWSPIPPSPCSPGWRVRR
jgi:hypothetical protein